MKEIPLSGKVGAGKVVLVDDDDYEWLSKHSFTMVDFRRRTKNPCNYHFIKSHHKNELGEWVTTTIHQLIMGKAPQGFKIDHIDRNTLNNQRSNLRIVSDALSCQNQKIAGLSIFAGVSWHSIGKKWATYIAGDGKHHYIGLFNNDVEAAHNYDFYALQIHGEGARLNFPDFNYTQFKPKRIVKSLLGLCEKSTS